MRKLILFIIALFLISVAEARFPRGTPVFVPQLVCNIVTGVASANSPCVSPAATCNGDVQTLTRTTSIASGTAVLTTSTSTFSGAGDAGKTIYVPGAGASGAILVTTILASPTPTATSVTLAVNANTTLTAVSTDITFGTDDADNFMAFNTWARANQGGNQVVLTIPNGSNCWFGTSQASPSQTPPMAALQANYWATGINNLLVEGTGATLSSLNGSGFNLAVDGIACARGLSDANGCSARIQSASSGASTITLTSNSFSAGYISRFSVNKWIMIGGLDIQGNWASPGGRPTNLHYFEWRQITAICNNTGACPGAAIITLDRPLSNTYLSTWPEYNQGNAFEQDAGGPAGIWLMYDAWNASVEYLGITIAQAGQTYTGLRNATFRNVTIAGGGGLIPSQNETFNCFTCDYTGLTIEVDKLLGTVTFDGLLVSQLKTQSSSVDLLIVKNATVGNNILGGGKRTEISDTTTPAWTPGAYAYGASTTSICTRCTVTSFTGYGSYDQVGGPGNGVFYTMTSGILKYPNTAANGTVIAQRPWAPITGNTFWRVGSGGSGDTIGLFRPQSITQDPWPSVTDNQTALTNVTTGACVTPQPLAVSTSIFSAGDVGKVIYVPGATSGGAGTLRTWIIGFTDAQHVTLGSACNNALAASAQTLQWGTSNVNVVTNESGGLPTWTSSLQGVRPHPSPQYTCDTCSGNVTIASTSVQNGATPLAPMGSYVSYPFAPTTTGTLGLLPTYGKLVSATINVTQAYSGAGSAVLNVTGQFGIPTVQQVAGTSWAWFPRVNLKQTGIRVITPGGVTCDTGGGPVGGACSGDTINSTDGFPPGDIWIKGGIQPYMANTTGVGTQPLVTVTVQTDQGVVP